MSTSIKNTPLHLTHMMVVRRIKGNTRGLGYWAARDFQRKQSLIDRKNDNIQAAQDAREEYIKAGIIVPNGVSE